MDTFDKALKRIKKDRREEGIKQVWVSKTAYEEAKRAAEILSEYTR
jgi:ribosomal protein S21